jgi:hypothetical protein
MSAIATVERAERLVGQTAQAGRVLGFQLGALYPSFSGVPRARLADVFDRHGFADVAAQIRDVDAERALTTVVGRVGKSRRDGLRVDALEADTDDSHVRAWGIYQVSRQPGERASTFTIGARVFVAHDTIYHAAPLDAAEIPEARKLAAELAAAAERLLVEADTEAVSRAIFAAVKGSGALPFVSRGAYVAVSGFDGTDRVVALFREIRDRFYDGGTRAGIRTSAVAITEVDTDAVSDSVLDDFERRIAESAARLREEASSGKVRASTIQARRDEIATMAQQARERAGWLGSRADRLGEQIATLSRAYAEAVDATTLRFPDALAKVAGVEAAPPPPPPPPPPPGGSPPPDGDAGASGAAEKAEEPAAPKGLFDF